MIDLEILEGTSKGIEVVLHTDGTGYWSSVAAAVRCTKLEIVYVERDSTPPTFGELHVTFDMRTWDPVLVGLIYTDKLFLVELRTFLQSLGFSEAGTADVSYSEQGMQGEDFVSCDVGDVFLAEARVVLD